jgi:large subunit ribosomal protein L21
MYAIIEDSGTQIKVEEGSEIRVANRDLADDQATVTFDKVLLVKGDDTDAKIGAPYVAEARVTADILSEEIGDKIRITKFKRRKGYLRRKGHRQSYIKVKVTGIEG